MSSPSPTSRHPNWGFAEQVLAGIAPGSRSCNLDDVAGLSPGVWSSFPIDDLTPTAVNSALLQYSQEAISGLLVITTDVSYRPFAGPFMTTAASLATFVDEYPDLYDDAFIAGDTLIMCPSLGRVIAVHHNGLIATVMGDRLLL